MEIALKAYFIDSKKIKKFLAASDDMQAIIDAIDKDAKSKFIYLHHLTLIPGDKPGINYIKCCGIFKDTCYSIEE